MSDLQAALERMISDHKAKTKATTAKRKTANTQRKQVGLPATEVDHRQRLYASDRWTDVALVLQVEHQHCACCGSTHRAVGPHIYLQRFHPRLGLHFEAFAKFNRAEYTGIPKRIDEVNREVPHCPACFDPKCVEAQLQQLSFTFEPAVAFQRPGSLFPEMEEA